MAIKKDDRLDLSSSYFQLDRLFIPAASALVRQILTNPGIVAMTGQPGTGKSITLFRVAYEASKGGNPVAVVWPKESRPPDTALRFPEDWKVSYLAPDEKAVAQFWRTFPYQKGQIIVTDEPVLDLWQNEDAAAIPKDATILCTFDTPFFGLDVAYFLNSLLNQKQIFEHFSGIISQVMLRRLCKTCGKQLPASLEDTLLVPPVNEEATVWQEVGCAECQNSGCKGHSNANDILWINDEVRLMIQDYLVRNVMGIPPTACHISMPDYAAELLRQGTIGLKTYKGLMFQNPLLRLGH